jgi:hypothetical protein
MSEANCTCNKKKTPEGKDKLKKFKTASGRSVYIGKKGGIYVKGKNGSLYSAPAKIKRQVISSQGSKLLDKFL